MVEREDLNELIREAVGVLSEGFAIFDSEHRLIFANQASLKDFEKLYGRMKDGLSYEEALRAGIRELLPDWPEEQVREGAALITATLESGQAYDLPSDQGVLSRVVYRSMSNGNRAAVSTHIQDLHDRELELEKARNKAESANEAKSTFLANMSHEIRTPLNGMLGMAQVLASSNLDEAQREQVDAILDSGKTLISLLNDVLDLSKIEAGKLEIAPVDADLSHVLRRLQKLWEAVAEEKGMALSMDFGSSLVPQLKFDTVRVRQCVANLISNAVKFTSEGEVAVHASMPKTGPNAGLVQIRVTDTGIGMDEETQNRLFAPFTQAEASTARRFGGTGLGLSISRKLAQMMGGDLTVKSRVGEGSTFTFTFAAEPSSGQAKPSEGSDEGARAAARQSGPMNILVVDDVALNRKVARLFLETQGWKINEASHGGEALEKLAVDSFDLVLLDVHMPVLDGPSTLKKLRESGEPYANVPVIALTANAMSGDRAKYLAMGMDGYISKPIDQRELFAEIARVRSLARERTAA